MNWLQARRLLRKASGRRPEPRGGAQTSIADGAMPPNGIARTRRVEELVTVRAASLCVASGKGGTGKSVVTASLAHLLSTRGRTLVVDADLGVGNAHILQDISPERTFVDVVEGRASVREVVQSCGGGIDLIGGGCGVSRMSDLAPFELELLADGLADVERDYGYLLVDSAAGISQQTMSFAAASDVVLLVTTPDLTAMTDAYAFLKVFLARRPDATPLLLVNRVRDEEEAMRINERIARVADRFLGAAPRYVGWLPDDDAVTRSVNQRGPVVCVAPSAAWSRQLRIVVVGLLQELASVHARGLGRTLRGSQRATARTA